MRVPVHFRPLESGSEPFYKSIKAVLVNVVPDAP